MAQDVLAEQLPERAATRELIEVHRHPAAHREALNPIASAFGLDERCAFIRTEWRDKEAVEAAVQWALLGQEPFHRADVRAAEDELGLGGILLLLDHGLDRGQHLSALFLRARHEVGELVDDRKRLLLAAEPIESAEEIRHVGEIGTHAQRLLERSRELSQLSAAGVGLGNQDDCGLLMGEGAK